jgi:hypothetical protein
VVEHVTENHGVGSSILPLGKLAQVLKSVTRADLKSAEGKTSCGFESHPGQINPAF